MYVNVTLRRIRANIVAVERNEYTSHKMKLVDISEGKIEEVFEWYN